MAGGINQYGYAGGDPVNNSDPFGLFGCRNQSICDLLDKVQRLADKVLGESEVAQVPLAAGTTAAGPGETRIRVATTSTLTLTRTEGGSSIAVGFRGNAFVENVPGPDPLVTEAAVDLGTGAVSVKGNVLVKFEVNGNLREGNLNFKVGPFSWNKTIPADPPVEEQKKPD